ncbi:MAG: Crp/Fnr family transcriptional regulator [Bacteroidaceae bacterium]
MDISTKYRLLTHLPLLQGLSGQDLARLEESHGLEMEHIPPSRIPLLNQGDACTHLIMVASGMLRRKHTTADGRLVITASIPPPVAIEPESLYGLNCHYHNSYFAESELQTISIRKNDVGKRLMNHPIFRYNLLNYLSAITHKQNRLIVPTPYRSVSEKFLHLVETLCRDEETDIILNVKMNDLALYMEETRLTISRMLNMQANDKAIYISRSTINIPSMKTFREYILSMGMHNTTDDLGHR